MTEKHTVLVTGGAGYIGSHVVRQLGDAGYPVIVLDNLSSGTKEAVLHGELVEGNTADQHLVGLLLKQRDIRTVLHFAAYISVPESVSDPLKYYGNNTSATRNLLECCQETGVENFVFSSTAAVYGIPDSGKVDEDSATQPINPYGASKRMSEIMLADVCQAGSMRHVILRYFNVAGADRDCRIGQSTPEASALIKVACEVAAGRREKLEIFGTDYSTPDGTGIRDYIHVEDLAAAHIDAVEYLENGGESVTLNCGYGHGFSVREVIQAVENISGETLKVVESARRPGDAGEVISIADRIRETLDWSPQYDDLETIVRDSLAWERKLAGD